MFQWWQYFSAWNLRRLELRTTCSTSWWPSWPGTSWSRSCWKCCSVWDEAPVSVAFFTHSSASSRCLIEFLVVFCCCCCWLVSRVGSYQGSSSSSNTEYPLKWCALQRCLIATWLMPGKAAAVSVLFLLSKKCASSCHFNALERNPRWTSNGMTLLKNKFLGCPTLYHLCKTCTWITSYWSLSVAKYQWNMFRSLYFYIFLSSFF